MKKFFGLLIVVLFLGSCTNIEDLIKSSKSDDIMKANEIIGKTKDTTYVCELLKDIYSYRGSSGNTLKYMGFTMYQSKVLALKEVSNLQPPHKISYKPDSVIVEFYKSWAKMKGYNCDCLK